MQFNAYITLFQFLLGVGIYKNLIVWPCMLQMGRLTQCGAIILFCTITIFTMSKLPLDLDSLCSTVISEDLKIFKLGSHDMIIRVIFASI